MKLSVSNSGGSYKPPPSTGSANAAEHRYFPGSGADRPAKKKPKKKSAPKRTSSAGYVSPFKDLAAGYSGPSALDMILTQLPQKEVDYQKEATKIYQPTLDYLDKQSGEAKKRGSTFDRELANMFGAVAGSIDRQAGDINKQYGNALNTVRSATNQGVGAVNKNYDDAAREQAAMLKQLGIEAAAPETLTRGNEDEAFFKSLIQSGGNASQNFLNETNQGDIQYNRAQAGITRQMGAEARAENKLGLQDILGSLAGQKVDLRTTINQQAQQMQQAAAAQQLEAQKQAAAAMESDRAYQLQNRQFNFQMQNADADNQMDQARLMLDTSRFEAGRTDANRNYQLALQKLASSGNKANTPSDAWGKGADLATRLYGGNQQAAGNAIQAVRDAIAANGASVNQWKNPNDLVRAVLQRNPGANDVTQLTSLATYLYQQIFK
jgi:hypothetical protein